MTLKTLLIASLFLVGCAGDMTDEPARGSIGKADLVGSCAADDCGGPSADGNCWCDDDCAELGDCCSDKAEVCEPSEPGGCRDDADCAEGAYCAFGAENTCGSQDTPGTCTTKPEACTTPAAPVCGCDGVTYGNACSAANSGKNVAHVGACEPPAGDDSCGGAAGTACGAGEYCKFGPEATTCDPDQAGTCEKIPTICNAVEAPVCGCDGNTHGNACQAAGAGVNVLHAGACLTL